MKKTIMTILGVSALLVAMCLNFRHAVDDYGIKENTMWSVALAQTSTGFPYTNTFYGSSGVKSKYCRRVGCTGTWKGTADVSGCVTVFGKKYCNFSANAVVTLTIYGEKENCTGGSEWYDCNACQSDCVPNSSNTGV